MNEEKNDNKDENAINLKLLNFNTDKHEKAIIDSINRYVELKDKLFTKEDFKMAAFFFSEGAIYSLTEFAKEFAKNIDLKSK